MRLDTGDAETTSAFYPIRRINVARVTLKRSSEGGQIDIPCQTGQPSSHCALVVLMSSSPSLPRELHRPPPDMNSTYTMVGVSCKGTFAQPRMLTETHSLWLLAYESPCLVYLFRPDLRRIFRQARLVLTRHEWFPALSPIRATSSLPIVSSFVILLLSTIFSCPHECFHQRSRANPCNQNPSLWFLSLSFRPGTRGPSHALGP
ncbi:hypothetical protein LZ32DRAFT_145842 [Colletotrichum eremochloae]|nr:hypothetical protein LZ32DRAFT_145842 [Colletotrichum eremochloae]